MKAIVLATLIGVLFFVGAAAQVPLTTAVQITKAEDARRYDSVLEGLLKSPNAAIRTRAALAAGRIGDEKAIPALAALLENDADDDVRAMAAFALGETESVKAADAVLKAIKSDVRPGVGQTTLSLKPANVTARLIEAAGKIAAANTKDDSAKALGKAILEVLEGEANNRFGQDRTTVLLGLTAILRVRPDGGEFTAAKFLLSKDGRIRTDAGNTLTRLKAKNANTTLRDMLENDREPTARGNAARALGAAEDKIALELLIKAATTDIDSRVRVAAIRALGSLKDAKAADKLIERTKFLLTPMHGDPGPIRPGQPVDDLKPIEVPLPKNELLELIATLGRLLQGTENEPAAELMISFRRSDKMRSPETEIALARLAPNVYAGQFVETGDWRAQSAQYAGLAEIAQMDDKIAGGAKLAVRLLLIQEMAERFSNGSEQLASARSRADLVQAFAAFKSENTTKILAPLLEIEADAFVRAAIAGVLADQPATKENLDALRGAFSRALIQDKHDNDAQLAILDALFKLDKKESVGTLLIALNATDYLVRKKAFEMLADTELQKDFPGIATSLENARSKHKDQVLPYSPVFGTKLGQVLNTDIDYRRALSRKNGSVKAVLTTEKGIFTIVFNPEEAPLTVDNWVKLARSGYFNGLEVHRVVPNFVMQDGDPRGDGNGGPGWSIRCEVNMLPYDRGAVGMALSGKDTGGSQWFVTHSPQPHLDGGYTVFGHVDEAGMKVVDNIVRGDKILKVVIIGR